VRVTFFGLQSASVGRARPLASSPTRLNSADDPWLRFFPSPAKGRDAKPGSPRLGRALRRSGIAAYAFPLSELHVGSTLQIGSHFQFLIRIALKTLSDCTNRNAPIAQIGIVPGRR
jgi:hypothetical protein